MKETVSWKIETEVTIKGVLYYIEAKGICECSTSSHYEDRYLVSEDIDSVDYVEISESQYWYDKEEEAIECTDEQTDMLDKYVTDLVKYGDCELEF